MRKIMALTAVMVMIVLCMVSACSKQAGNSETNDNNTVGEVNGEKITQAQLDKYVQLDKVNYQEAMANNSGDGLSEITPEIEKRMQDEMFQELVTTLLINQEADKQNITVSKAETEQAYQEQIQSAGTAEFDEWLQATGWGEEDVKYIVSTNLLYSKLMEPVIKQVKISDEDVKAYYDQNVAGINEISHILVTDENKAAEIISQLNSGADFDQLAKENSIDGSKDQGGYVGPAKTGQWVAPFEEAALSLKIGEFTQTPVQSQFGYHIIKADAARSFEESRNAILIELQNIKRQETAQQYMDNLRSNAVIVDNRAE